MEFINKFFNVYNAIIKIFVMIHLSFAIYLNQILIFLLLKYIFYRVIITHKI